MTLPPDLQPEVLLTAYASGIFPMADETETIRWYAPDPRAILELNGLVVSRSLRSRVRRGDYRVSFDQSFPQVIRACARCDRETWISPDIIRAYQELHRLGFAHSVEVWSEENLVGGLYGVSIGGAFFGESMFHRATDASKVALVHLVQKLKESGLALLDVQFMTDHLRSLGAVDISRKEYENRLAAALAIAHGW